MENKTIADDYIKSLEDIYGASEDFSCVEIAHFVAININMLIDLYRSCIPDENASKE